MKYVLIRSGLSEKGPQRLLTGRDYEEEELRRREGALDPVPASCRIQTDRPIYVSPDPCARATAEGVFCRRDWIAAPELEETPCGVHLPFPLPRWAHRALGGDRKALRSRLIPFLDELEAAGRDSAIVAHPGAIRELLALLRSKGYEIRGGGQMRCFEKAVAVPAVPHCGNCSHNCPLTRPGCDIGREKAIWLQHQKSGAGRG